MNDMNDHSAMRLSPRWHDVAYWGLLLLAAVAFMVMNVLTTLKEDDLAFSLVEGSWEPVRTLLDVARSHGHQFMDANGRTANLVAAVFCGLLGKTVFNVCNTLVFCLMAHLLSLLVARRRSLLVLALFLAVVGTCYPVPGETMLWLDGSCNYMWAITLSLLLTWYLLREHGRELGWGRGVLLLLAAAVAGSFNEATSFGFFLGWCLYYSFNRLRFNCRALVVLAGYLLGIAVIVASPGAWARAASGDIVINMGLGDLLSSRWYIFSEKMWRFYLPTVAALAGIAVMAWKGARTARRCVWTYVFFALALVMFALGVVHERAYAPLVTVAFIIVAMIAHAVLGKWPWARGGAIAVCLALAAFTAIRGIGVLSAYKAYDDQTVAEIRQAPDQAILLQRQFDGYSRFVKPLNYISTEFFGHEVVYCAYYGKDNVQFVSDSVYSRYHSGRLLDGASPLPMTSDNEALADSVWTFDGQDYMAILLHVDTIPHTPQTARYYMSQPSSDMTPAERQRRANYGLVTDYNPKGFYPLMYQGRCLLIAPLPDNSTSRMVFPLEYGSDPAELCLTPR